MTWFWSKTAGIVNSDHVAVIYVHRVDSIIPIRWDVRAELADRGRAVVLSSWDSEQQARQEVDQILSGLQAQDR